MADTSTTKHPIPSANPDVLEYNAKAFDEFTNSNNDTYIDRNGVVRYTSTGVRKKVGWYSVGFWLDNPDLTDANQYVRFNSTGADYAPLTLPYTVDSVTNPDPETLVGTELRKVNSVTETTITEAQEDILGSRIHKGSNGESAQVGDTGLIDISALRDSSSNTLYFLLDSNGDQSNVNGDITSLSFPNLTATIGGNDYNLYKATKSPKALYSSENPNLDYSKLSENMTVYLNSEVFINVNTEVVCKVIKQGDGEFNVSAGVLLTIHKLDAGPFRVFTGDGDVKLFNSINTETHPEWFGAEAYSNVQDALDGVNSQPAMQKLNASLPAFGGEVKWSGLYGTDASFVIDRQGVHIKGIGAGLASGIIPRNDVTTIEIQTGVFECHLTDAYVSGYKNRTLNTQGTNPCIKANNAYLLRFTNIYTEEGSASAEFTNCSDMHIQSWTGEDSTNGITLIGCIQNTFNEINLFDLNKLGSIGSPQGTFLKVNATSRDNTFTNLNYRQGDKKLKDGIVVEGTDNIIGIGAINDLSDAAITLQGALCTGNTLSGINSRNCARHALIQQGATKNEINGGKAKNCGTGLKVVSDAGELNDISITFDNVTTNISVDAGSQQQVINPKMLRQIGTTAQRPDVTIGVMIGFRYTNTTTGTIETWDGTAWI